MKKILAAITAVICILVMGYVYPQWSSVDYNTYEERHKAGLTYLKDGDYKLAEKALLKAVELEPDNLDGYVCLEYFYRVSGDSEKREKTREDIEPLGFDNSVVSRVISEYRLLENFHAVYITNENNEIFTFFDRSDNPLKRDELYSNGEYIRSIYYYDDSGIISYEEFEKKEGLYEWRGAKVQYIYDENDRLIQKKDSTRGYINYSYDENGNISEIDYQSLHSTGNGKTPYREYYEDGRLVRTLSSKGLDCFDTETIYDSDGYITKQYELNEKGEVIKYNLFEYTKGTEYNETICCSYYTDNILDYKQTVKTQKYKTLETVTEYFDRNGTLIKTVAKDTDGIEKTVYTVDLSNDFRPLTEEEVAMVNSYSNQLGCLRQPFIKADDIPLGDLLRSIPIDDYLTDEDKDELAALKEEGVPLNYRKIELEIISSGYYKKVPYDALEAVLNEYFDISYSQLRNKDNALYSQNYNCFYLFKSDNYYYNNSLYLDFICIGGEISKDYLKLYSPDRTIVFDIKDDRYIIKSVIAEKHLTDTQENEKTTASEDDKTKYIYRLKDSFGLKSNKKGAEYNKAMAEYENIIRDTLPDKVSSLANLPGIWLYDVTGDGMPELICAEIFASWKVYSYRNGRVNELDVPSECGGDAGKILFSDGSILGLMDKGYWQTFSYYTYNTDGSVNTTYFSLDTDYITQENKCSINGKTVSEEEYNKFIQKFRDKFLHGRADYEYITLYDKVAV